MGQVHAIAGGKGGVGKTTTTANLAAAFAAAGYDTVAVDADLAMANLGPSLGVDPDAGPTVHDVLAGEAEATATVRETPFGFDVAPGTQSLEGFAAADPANFRSLVDPLRERYDVVLLDTSAGLSHEVTVPVGIADSVVLVTTPDLVAIKDAAKTGELTKRVDGDVAGVCITRARTDAATERIVSELGDDVLAAVPETPGTGVDGAIVPTGSPAAVAYNGLAANLLGTDELPETAGRYAHAPPDAPEPPAVDRDSLTPAVVLADAESDDGNDTGESPGEATVPDGTSVTPEDDREAAAPDAGDDMADDTDADPADATVDDVTPDEMDTTAIIEAEMAAADAMREDDGSDEAAEADEEEEPDDADSERSGAFSRLRGIFE
ncbi:MinD/ParA family ATP-binding protein [Halomarina litorea]|uniref:MinD/ParA family ATP-binding protein n=1 Tax=Halomarina litorea TaxID=2961595 RepID=UPI0020C25E80|nr:AAA family ATPase [Halomarina sp. BCD28]